ncbi:MAG TPA: proton-conducting transporter membrane subunit, partial [Bdellovibrionota bacterium]|nr:proton-conducting transporter membrane subunit [Bdellovibrionota bacterium]
FLEVTAVASYILISFGRGRDALEGAFKYLLLSSVATAMLLTAIGLMIGIAGGTSFALISDALKSQPNHLYAQLSLALFVAGLFIKSGLVPFHGWLPGAYSEAPSPVSVLLAGIITKTTGVYTLVRLVITVFGPHPTTQGLLLAFGAISIVVGAIAALTQNDFKRMLAYSSISQVGYIILGLGGGTEIAIAGAVLHLFNHAVFKTLLFVNASAVEQQTKTRDMNRLGGLSNRMPVTGTTSAIAFLSTAGIPPFSGFWSKLLIIIGVWKAGFPGYAILGIAASLLTLAYFLAMQRKMFFGKLMTGFEDLKEAGAWITIPAILLAALTFGLGVAAPWLFETFLIPIRSIL